MRKHSRLIGLVLALAVVAGACATAEAAGPPDIKYGRDICIQCGMIVSEARFAAAYTTPDGEKLAFDDTGDLLLYQRSTGDPIDPHEAWVHDYETELWVRGEEAYFVHTDEVTSPMGFGILCFSDEGRAASFAAKAGDDVLDWKSVLALPIQVRQPGNMNMPDTTSTTEHDQTDS